MGGEIFIGVRYIENNETKETLMLRWTNPFPHRFIHPTFLNQGKEFYKYISEAKKDNKDVPLLLDNVQNSEYGIILIDFIHRKIFSRNTYAAPGKFLLIYHSDMKDNINAIKQLLKRGMIKKVYGGIGKKDPVKGKNIPLDTFTKMLPDILKGKDMYRGFYNILLADNVFNIDEKGTFPNYNEVKKWMKRHGWTSEIDKTTFRDV